MESDYNTDESGSDEDNFGLKNMKDALEELEEYDEEYEGEFDEEYDPKKCNELKNLLTFSLHFDVNLHHSIFS